MKNTWLMHLIEQAQPTTTEATTAATTAAPQSDYSSLIGLALMLAVFFFLIILPQSRKAKKQAQFLAALQKGDAIVTNAGIYGKIVSIEPRVITLEIAPNVKIRVDRQAIAGKEIAVEAKAA